ncbi:MAG: PEP-CTERM sorting domain-containing protein [Verrucomicrobiota bacterium]
MRKKSVITPICSGLAILAGSFSFMGTAEAFTLLSEDFEGASNLFGTGTYNYSQNYTMPNLLSPGGGIKYMNGGAGVNGAVSTNTFTATGSPLNLLTGGITGAQIDSGLISYNIYAQFSTYRLQNDNGTLSVQFLDAGSSPLGSALNIGGPAFVSALGSGNNGSYTDARNWAADSLAGVVPSGARFASVQIFEVKTAPGTAIDGYMDNVNFSINPVPEPGTIALFALGGGLAALASRRRRL